MKENKPCLLLLNDIHISKDNIPAFQANWQEAMGICRERDIREVVVGGDLFFSRAAQTLDVLLAVRDMLVSAADHDIHVTLAEGNHDKVNQESLRGYCHVFDRHPNVTVVDEYLTLCRPEWKFALHVMSYFPEDGSFAERLGRLAAEALSGEPEHFLYIHEGINGALAQPSEKELPARIFSPFDKVFVGHYHNRTVIPGTGIEYIGSSRQHNFGEDEEKGYTVLYTDGTYEFVKNRVNMRYRVMDMLPDSSGILSFPVLPFFADLSGSFPIPYRATVSSICSTSSLRCATIHTRIPTPPPQRNSFTTAASRCVFPVPVGICTITLR